MTYITVLFCSMLALPFLFLSIAGKGTSAILEGVLAGIINGGIAFIVGLFFIIVFESSVLIVMRCKIVGDGLWGTVLAVVVFAALTGFIVFVLFSLLGAFLSLPAALWSSIIMAIGRLCNWIGTKSLVCYNGLIGKIMKRSQRVV